MIAWLLANRTVAEIGGALLAALGVWALWVHHDHVEQQIGDQKCLAAVTVTKDQAAAEAAEAEVNYQAQLTRAKEDYDEALAAIPVRTVTTPVWVQRGPSPTCPGAVPSPAPSGGQAAGAGGTDAGSRGGAVDIRPAINAFEAKYETVIAQCRETIADWPQPSGVNNAQSH
jgi:hypothetical protein